MPMELDDVVGAARSARSSLSSRSTPADVYGLTRGMTPQEKKDLAVRLLQDNQSP